MTTSRSVRDVVVYKKAYAWVLAIYKLTATFPKHELFGLTSQLRRAAVSVPANIAEGFVKRGHADKLRYYNIAQGSLEEARFYLTLSMDLEYGDTTHLIEGMDEIGRMLAAYISTLARTESP